MTFVATLSSFVGNREIKPNNKTKEEIVEGFSLIPLFHTGPESHELTRIDKYLDSWLNRTQFVKVLTESHSP